MYTAVKKNRKAYFLAFRFFFLFEFFVLPTSYFPDTISIIAALGLNFSVRNGKRCDPKAKSGEQKTQKSFLLIQKGTWKE